MHWNTEAFLQTLPIMAKGMAGIFLVTAVIILAMYLLVKFTGKDKK
jgi:Na+-transporting methylmalonyl-CoA/oxaloacetate decarboxylase gamma subunit